MPARLDLGIMKNQKQFIGFAAVGVISTCFNLGSRYAFELVFSYELALFGANVVGVVTAFLMNRWFVFQTYNAGAITEMSRFVIVNLVGIAVSWSVAVFLFHKALPAIGFVWHPDLVALAIGIAVPVIPDYFAHRLWTFRQ